MNSTWRWMRQAGNVGRPISKYSAMPIAGSKKISSSQPFAASGERRKGTTTIIAIRTAHSTAKKTLTQKVWSVRSAGMSE